MSYLIDTNVLSELYRKTPDPKVARWISQRPASTMFLSVLTLGELRKGIESSRNIHKKEQLTDWLETEIPHFFSGRILSIDSGIADRWGKILADVGRPLPAIDSLIGASADYYGLTLVTRNTRDFIDMGLDMINPWEFN